MKACPRSSSTVYPADHRSATTLQQTSEPGPRNTYTRKHKRSHGWRVTTVSTSQWLCKQSQPIPDPCVAYQHCFCPSQTYPILRGAGRHENAPLVQGSMHRSRRGSEKERAVIHFSHPSQTMPQPSDIRCKLSPPPRRSLGAGNGCNIICRGGFVCRQPRVVLFTSHRPKA